MTPSSVNPEIKVVLVNDDEPQLELMAEMLRGSGFQVLTAADGRQGLDLALAHHPALVISDVSMPRMDGIELCRCVRQEPTLNATRVLLVSALRRDSASVVEGLQAGADDYLEVPFDPMRLVAKAAQLVERGAAEDQLRQQLDFMRAVMESLGEGVYAIDADGQVTFLNPAGELALGWTHEEMHGRRVHEMIHADRVECGEVEPPACPLLSVLRTGETARVENDVFTRKNGTTVPVSYTSAPIRSGGRIVGAVLAFRDRTNRKILEDSLRHAQKMEAVGHLAGGIAHDFNNLLTAITGFSDLALERASHDDALRADIQEVQHAARRATTLTRQLLTFSRKQVLQPQVLDVNAVVRETRTMLGRLIGEDVELRTILSKDVGAVRVDRGQLEQVIINLAVNARDAMRGGGSLTIETAVESLSEIGPGESSSTQYVALIITDTGSGMTAETQAQIFEPFFTTKQPGRGTGLGLATVYAIVTQCGGRIHVDSVVGQGTRFRVYLPSVSDRAPVSDSSSAGQATSLTGETVLVVEDDAGVRQVVLGVLGRLGYRVISAKGGELACVMYEDTGTPIDLLLTDIVMPSMNGIAVAERLRRGRPSLKVLLMSGYAHDPSIQRDASGVVYPLIQKPFTPDALAKKVREVLGD